jgi:hypothetical protein
MNSESKVKSVLMGGTTYLDQQSLLDFLAQRSKLIIEELRRRGTPLTDTEFLRGQSYEQQVIINAIQPPTQTTR